MAPSAGTRPSFLFSMFIFLTLVPVQMTTDTSSALDVEQTFNMGGIVNLDSRIGREHKIAMEVAVEDFNSKTMGHTFSLHFTPTNGDPLRSAIAAKELIQKQHALAIIGMETWEESTLVADVGNEFQVPVLSLSSPSVITPFASHRWPYLLQMASNGSDQISCLASIVSLYRWKRVIVIYEEEPYGGDSGAFFLLSKALQESGAKIEYSISLPPSQSLKDPKKTVQKDLEKLVNEQCYSRVFIVLRLTSNVAGHLFEGAREMGLVEKESVWIITEEVTDYLHSLNDSAISSIEGALGIKASYTTSTESFQDFEAKFWLKFSKEYPKEPGSEPGFHALLAYDGMMAIGKAIERSTSSKTLLKQIQSTNFTGLSGNISFEDSKLLSPKNYSIVNVTPKNFTEVDLWISGAGFSKSHSRTSGLFEGEMLARNVTWPGKLNCSTVPKGWAMPNARKELRIGVLEYHIFKNFVEVFNGKTPKKNRYSGLCVELFENVTMTLGYNLSYEFKPYNGTYASLLDLVYNKALDAVIGDLTILANRTNYVDFTQPYAESGLAMILPVDSDNSSKGWIFLKPFRRELWFATFGIMIYTMLVVWFIEHRSNPEFRGPWRSQLSTAVWFTFSTLFFSQRENIQSSYTRVVVIIWLFVVLVLTQSYTADLSSMLTMARLKQNETDFETLVIKKAKVGCHHNSFVKRVLVDVLKFDAENIVHIDTRFDYFHDNFTAGKITAAFLEIPYARLFQNEYCDKYTITLPHYGFGGLGFAFAKGSPIAGDVSRAILNLTESGDLKKLEKRFNTVRRCSDKNGGNQSDTERLGLASFWGLFVLSAATSTLCLLGSVFPSLKRFACYKRQVQEHVASIWNIALSFLRSIPHGERTSTDNGAAGMRWEVGVRSYNWISQTVRDVPENHQSN